MNANKKEAIKRSQHWWYCDNIVNHRGKIGLLRMDFPQVFILIRDYGKLLCSFDEFKKHLAEVNFFNPDERKDADLEEILIDAWNFLALEEEEEDRLAFLRENENEENY